MGEHFLCSSECVCGWQWKWNYDALIRRIIPSCGEFLCKLRLEKKNANCFQERLVSPKWELKFNLKSRDVGVLHVCCAHSSFLFAQKSASPAHTEHSTPQSVPAVVYALVRPWLSMLLGHTAVLIDTVVRIRHRHAIASRDKIGNGAVFIPKASHGWNTIVSFLELWVG